jgi:hypothetical protein
MVFDGLVDNDRDYPTINEFMCNKKKNSPTLIKHVTST